MSVHVSALLGRAGFSLLKVSSFSSGKRPCFCFDGKASVMGGERGPAGSSLDVLYMCPHAIDGPHAVDVS